MADHQYRSRPVQSQRYPSLLILAVFLIEYRQRLRIKKDRSCALEGNAMLRQIPASLRGIPFELILERFLHPRIIFLDYLLAEVHLNQPGAFRRPTEARRFSRVGCMRLLWRRMKFSG